MPGLKALDTITIIITVMSITTVTAMLLAIGLWI